MKNYDVIVIGGGPAGLAAAYNVKSAGKSVAIFENDLWGGTCPNRGCDPKKMLLSGVEARDRIAQLKGNGFSDVPFMNWSEIEAFKESYTSKIPAGSKGGLDSAGIDNYHGKVEFTSKNELKFEDEIFTADKFILATGQHPSILNIPGSDNMITSNEFLSLKQMPKKITFIGAGYIAFELANIANATGAEVHLVHHNDRPLKAFDGEFVNDMVEQMKSRGIKFHFNIDTKEIKKSEAGFELISDSYKLNSDLIVCATGRIPSVEGLNLSAAGVEYSRKGIKVNGHLQTTNQNVFAIGDVVDRPQPKLTPVAGFDANYVTDYIDKKTTDPIQYPSIPTLVYGSPKMARVGITTSEAEANPDQYRIVSSNLTSWYTYYRIHEPIAKAKIIFDKTNQVVGATVLTEQADELINLLTLVIDKKIANAEYSKLIMGYPTVASDLEYLI